LESLDKVYNNLIRALLANSLAMMFISLLLSGAKGENRFFQPSARPLQEFQEF
jgi:hypothetical protein